MKRYRILNFDMDSRSHFIQFYRDRLGLSEHDDANYQRVINPIKINFGEANIDTKIQNLIDIGSKPLSIIAYHNKFLEQIRNAFIIGSYYPALTGACALGERILNHLIINLREEFRTTPEYKRVYRNNSFDNWDIVINTLESWNILTPKSFSDFKSLKERRNKSIHFNTETDTNEKQQSYDAIILIQSIVEEQFTAFGDRPWFITDIPGEIYIKKDWESNPFIKLVYLPNSLLLGYKHIIGSMTPISITINDDFEYEEGTITDEDFSKRRNDQRQ